MDHDGVRVAPGTTEAEQLGAEAFPRRRIRGGAVFLVTAVGRVRAGRALRRWLAVFGGSPADAAGYVGSGGGAAASSSTALGGLDLLDELVALVDAAL
jgi:hypothetical protein